MAEGGGYDEVTHNSANPIFRFSHRQRLSLAARIIAPQPGEAILDFGGGDGFVVSGLAAKSPDTHYTILEPYLVPQLAMALNSSSIRWVKEVSDLPEARFDKIICLEVLEHLSESSLEAALPLFRDRLKTGGLCILSMPLEVGPPALFKNAIRLAAGRLHDNTTFRRVIQSVFFDTREIPRPTSNGFVPGHIGFDAFAMLSRIERETGFRVEKRMTSPFSVLPWFLNSQVYFVLRATN